MNIHEYQAKAILKEYGVHVLNGYHISDRKDIEKNARKIETDIAVVKAQIHAGGRGKAGGVKLVESLTEAMEVSNDLFSYSNEFSGSEVSEFNHLTAKLEVNSLIIKGELNIEFNYCTSKYKEENILNLKKDYLNKMKILIDYLKNFNRIQLTPSDFDLVDLDQEEIALLFE